MRLRFPLGRLHRVFVGGPEGVRMTLYASLAKPARPSKPFETCWAVSSLGFQLRTSASGACLLGSEGLSY